MNWDLIQRRHEYTMASYDNLIAMYERKPLPFIEIGNNPKCLYDLGTDTITWLGDLSP